MFASIAIVLSLGAALVESLADMPRLDLIISYAVPIPLLVLVPRFARRIFSRVRQRTKEGWVHRIEMLSLGIVILNVPASLWLHNQGADIQYDRLLHFVAAALSAYIAVLAVAALARKDASRLFLIGSASFILLVGVFAWEAFQWGSDTLLGSGFFGDKVQTSVRDTTEDIVLGMFGGFGALTAIAVYFRSFVANFLTSR